MKECKHVIIDDLDKNKPNVVEIFFNALMNRDKNKDTRVIVFKGKIKDELYKSIK